MPSYIRHLDFDSKRSKTIVYSLGAFIVCLEIFALIMMTIY